MRLCMLCYDKVNRSTSRALSRPRPSFPGNLDPYKQLTNFPTVGNQLSVRVPTTPDGTTQTHLRRINVAIRHG